MIIVLFVIFFIVFYSMIENLKSKIKKPENHRSLTVRFKGHELVTHPFFSEVVIPKIKKNNATQYKKYMEAKQDSNKNRVKGWGRSFFNSIFYPENQNRSVSFTKFDNVVWDNFNKIFSNEISLIRIIELKS